jgi:hypothetical protein
VEVLRASVVLVIACLVVMFRPGLLSTCFCNWQQWLQHRLAIYGHITRLPFSQVRAGDRVWVTGVKTRSAGDFCMQPGNSVQVEWPCLMFALLAFSSGGGSVGWPLRWRGRYVTGI